MGACHLLLGRPWQYDHKVVQDGKANTYSFVFERTKIVLPPSKDLDKPRPAEDGTNLLSLAQFEEELQKSEIIYVLIGKEVGAKAIILDAIASLIAKFNDILSVELSERLPPLKDIQHCIDLDPCVILPNRPHYKISPSEHEELRKQVEELLAKGHV